MSIVSLLAKLDPRILWIAEFCPLTYDPFIPIKTWVFKSFKSFKTFKSLWSRHFYLIVFVLVTYICCLISNFQLIFLWTIFSNICSSSCQGVTWYQLRHCIKFLIKNIIKIFFTRKSYFFKTFFYREHVKKDLMHYSALIVKTFFIILIRTWVSLLSGKRNL